MSVVGLELNASRARAVHGTGLGPPGGLDLDDGRRDLPLAVSLEGRSPVVGSAGARLRRKAPHLAALDFLPALGQSREWIAGRHRLDAAAVLGLVFQRLHQSLGRSEGVFLTLPTYLSDAQEVQALQLAGKRAGRCWAPRPRRPPPPWPPINGCRGPAWPSSWTWTATP